MDEILNKILSIKNTNNPYLDISNLLKRLHTDGPSNSEILETIALYKKFHNEYFELLEEQIISSMGLFYKIDTPKTLYSLLIGAIGRNHKEKYGKLLTPVQASVRRAIDDNQYISISAPTSAGKSFSIRDFIAEQQGDAVVIVPSRALIAEYINALREGLNNNKNVMVLSFVDSIFKIRNLRRIFVLTPERARDLFANTGELNIEVVFFDEAQISEETPRGVIFDSLVRRINKYFPKARLIFAHPFIENPDAQLKKHNLPLNNAFSKSYTHGATGKISVYRHKNGKFYYFSPFEEKGHLLSKCVPFDGEFDKFSFDGKKSVLIYVSKASIYNDEFREEFRKYIENFNEVTDENALNIIENIKKIIGADDEEHKSLLVSLLKKGVVIHHGSVPLDVRFLLENFIRSGYAKICFATSTLAQGVNMPFDIVWLQNMRIIGESESIRALAFKNLIGRAGRLTNNKVYDYGYVFTENPELYSRRINEKYSLSDTSVIEMDSNEKSADDKEVIDSIKNNDFNDVLNLPNKRVDRLSSPHVLLACSNILEILYANNENLNDISGEEKKPLRQRVRDNFKLIFTASIGRALENGEDAVFNQALMIFLLAISGKSFREISGIRYSYISRTQGNAKFVQQAAKLPDSSLTKPYPLFKPIPSSEVSYDAVIFDTYDYFDQVISYSLSDVFSAAFKIHLNLTSDYRSNKIIELLKFGTNNIDHILLMRYGFSPEIVSEIMPYIRFINEQNIIFHETINTAPEYLKDISKWYLP